MLRVPRACLRLLLIALAILVSLPLALLSRACSAVGAWRAGLRLAALAQGLWARLSLAVAGVRLESVGDPFDGAALIVANHQSWLDIPVLAALFRCRFVAKGEIAAWPLLGPLSRATGTLFLSRGRKRDVLRVNLELERTLAAGVSAVVFPEGRATSGEDVQSFHPALLEVAARQGLPCLALGLSYRTPGDERPVTLTVAWWDGTGLWKHLWRFLGLAEVVVDARWSGPHPPCERKRLAELLRAEVVRLRGAARVANRYETQPERARD